MLIGAGTVQSPPPIRKEQTGKLTEAALLQFTFRSNTVAMSSALWKRGADSLEEMCRELRLCLENPSVICSVTTHLPGHQMSSEPVCMAGSRHRRHRHAQEAATLVVP